MPSNTLHVYCTPPNVCDRQCSNCRITKTPVFRRDGPDGVSLLCNACSVYYRKYKRMRDPNMDYTFRPRPRKGAAPRTPMSVTGRGMRHADADRDESPRTDAESVLGSSSSSSGNTEYGDSDNAGSDDTDYSAGSDDGAKSSEWDASTPRTSPVHAAASSQPAQCRDPHEKHRMPRRCIQGNEWWLVAAAWCAVHVLPPLLAPDASEHARRIADLRLAIWSIRETGSPGMYYAVRRLIGTAASGM